eukprot:scaffold82751_cov42-Prasinocladus_malaysianus.AAC.1
MRRRLFGSNTSGWNESARWIQALSWRSSVALSPRFSDPQSLILRSSSFSNSKVSVCRIY